MASEPTKVVELTKQESWAMAKMTARCALYMVAQRIFGSHWVRLRLYFPKFLMGFCWEDRLNARVMETAGKAFYGGTECACKGNSV